VGIIVDKIWVEPLSRPVRGKYDIVSAKYIFLTDKAVSEDWFLSSVKEIISHPPLSKFGICADFEQLVDLKDFVDILPTSEMYTYTASNTHQYKKTDVKSQIRKDEFIFSSIALNINEEIYRSVR
jgi:hypothetical protein